MQNSHAQKSILYPKQNPIDHAPPHSQIYHEKDLLTLVRIYCPTFPYTTLIDSLRATKDLDTENLPQSAGCRVVMTYDVDEHHALAGLVEEFPAGAARRVDTGPFLPNAKCFLL